MDSTARKLEIEKSNLGFEMTFRICAKLEIKNNNLIKGIQLEGLRVIGDVFDFASKYNLAGADEIIIIDITSSWFSRDSIISKIASTLENCFIPLTVGGGLRELRDIDSCLRSGAERVAINTIIFDNPGITSEIAEKYGAQAVVFNVQARYLNNRFYCFTENGRENTGVTIEDILAKIEADSVGEILLTSIDNDGSLNGVDQKLLSHTRNLTDLPIIYAGGIKSIENIESVFKLRANAVAISSALHYQHLKIENLKNQLILNGYPIRGIQNE